MTNAVPIFRALIIYGVCLPLAIFLGYLLASPADLANFGLMAGILLVMLLPMFLKWHYPWLLLSWNMIAGLYFLRRGDVPMVWVMSSISFTISFVSYILNRDLKFITLPSINRPLIFLLAVVLITAKFTGGFSFGAFGGATAGAKHYVYILCGVIGFYALTAQKIPHLKADFYVTLFYIGALTAAVGNMFTIISPNLYFIYWIFPPDFGMIDTYGAGNNFITRLGGVCVACVSIIYVLIARYGVLGILDLRRFWRLGLFLFCFVLSLFGGYRSKLIEVIALCGIVFCLEGLLKTKYFLAFMMAFVLGAAVVLPFASKLPTNIQRTLTFLPIDLDPEVQQNAAGSVEWRLQMWEKLLPQIPKYFWLGKGYSIDAHDLDLASQGLNAGGDDSDASALAGDYHNGPLSVIIPFGIFGVIGWLWLLYAIFKVLYNNFKFGAPEIAHLNRFLLAVYLVRLLMFFAVIGSFFNDLATVLSLAGLSMALNGGQRRPALAPEPVRTYERIRFVTAARASRISSPRV